MRNQTIQSRVAGRDRAWEGPHDRPREIDSTLRRAVYVRVASIYTTCQRCHRRVRRFTYLFRHPRPLLLSSAPTKPHLTPPPPPLEPTQTSSRASSSPVHSSFLSAGSRASRYRFAHASSVRPGMARAIRDHRGPCAVCRARSRESSVGVQADFLTWGESECSQR